MQEGAGARTDEPPPGPFAARPRHAVADRRSGPPDDAARAGASDPLALDVDDPPRQPRPAERRRPEGRRPPGELGVGGDSDDRALPGRAPPVGPHRGEAAREPGVPRHPVPARAADPREARALPRVRRGAVLSLAHQGHRRRGHLHRLGRARGRDDHIRGPGPGLPRRARAARTGRSARADGGDRRGRGARRGQRLRGAPRRLEARRARSLVGDRLQPPEPRRGDQRPSVRPVQPPVHEHGMGRRHHQVRQAAAGGVRPPRRRGASPVDRRVPELALLGAGGQGRSGVARARARRHRRAPGGAGAGLGVRRRRPRRADDQSRRARHGERSGGVRGRHRRPARPASSPTPSRAMGFPSPVTRTITPG